MEMKFMMSLLTQTNFVVGSKPVESCRGIAFVSKAISGFLTQLRRSTKDD